MSYSFPTTPFASASNLTYFFSVVNWLMSQAAPWMMLVFAATMMGMVVRMIYVAIRPAEENSQYEEDD